MKYRSSADAAAAFLYSHGHETGRRGGPRSRRVEPTAVAKAISVNPKSVRMVMDLSRGVVDELLDCVCERLNNHEASGTTPDHITTVAYNTLLAWLRGEPWA